MPRVKKEHKGRWVLVTEENVRLGAPCRVGSHVKTPNYGWGTGVDYTSIGTLAVVNRTTIGIKFPSFTKFNEKGKIWWGRFGEIELLLQENTHAKN